MTWDSGGIGQLGLILGCFIVCILAGSILETWDKTDNVVISNNLLSHKKPCTSKIKAATVCKEMDRTKCKAIVYDAGSSTCHIFSYSLKGMFSVSPTPTGFSYLETLCDVDDAAYEQNLEDDGYCMIQRIFDDDKPDCQAYHDDGFREDGLYTLHHGDEILDVWCEFDTNNGWTVIQRRQDGSQDFDLLWADYKRGFGDLNNEYWLGNYNIHQLTRNQDQKLQIYLVAADGSEVSADYTLFYIRDESGQYRIHTEGFSGNYGDALGGYNNIGFSTSDVDNDSHPDADCGARYSGGWWFYACHHGTLNGRFGQGQSSQGITWYYYQNRYDDMFVRTLMKITRCD